MKHKPHSSIYGKSTNIFSFKNRKKISLKQINNYQNKHAKIQKQQKQID